jgi:hypothetical protein
MQPNDCLGCVSTFGVNSRLVETGGKTDKIQNMNRKLPATNARVSSIRQNKRGEKKPAKTILTSPLKKLRHTPEIICS